MPLPLDRAMDTGWGLLRRQQGQDRRAVVRRTSSRALLRRGDYTGADLAGADLAGARVDDDDLTTLLTQLRGRLRTTVAPQTLTLSSSVVAFTDIGAPDVEIVNGVAYATGAVAPSGSWTAGSVYAVGALPDGVAGPRRQANRNAVAVTTSGQAVVVRVWVAPAGTVQLMAPSATVAWVDLAALTWVTT